METANLHSEMLVNPDWRHAGAYRIAAILNGNPYRAMIVTHPDNIELVKNLLESEKKNEPDDGFIHTIRPVGIEVVGNSALEKERPSGRCISYWDYSKWWDGTGKPPQWAINFGFIKPEMEPVFYEVNTPRITVFNPKTSALNWAR